MKRIIIILLAVLPLCLWAQRSRSRDTYTPAPDEQVQVTNEDSSDNIKSTKKASKSDEDKSKKSDKKIVTGFSGGMMIHGGYSFSFSPNELFRNGSLEGSKLSELPKDGFTFGLGGTLRLHLIDHIHIGGEGHMSFMPLMSSGSSIRTGWGGAMCDFYATLGIVRPLIGMTIGGGAMRRVYVPENAEQITKGENGMVYNASYSKTPFFLLDPYVGLEIALNKIALLIRIDYMLPFGKDNDGLATPTVKWSNFVTPSGPRLYVGFLFGH